VIKARGKTGDGKDLVVLGLSEENLARLVAQEPISFNLSEIGLSPIQVVIVGGRTEEELMADLRKLTP
jgi:hypothetical protein